MPRYAKGLLSISPAIFIISRIEVDLLECHVLEASYYIIMFTATRLQAATYFLGVCLFSIAFLVFLNSSVSFVITDLIGQTTQVGDAVGTLGFADELVVLVACPAWGVISDRLGVRTVSILTTENANHAQL